MPATTIFLLVGAFALSVGLAAFQYFYKAKGKTSRNAIFAVLRFISLFSILVLLINLKITSTHYTLEKPKLAIAADNSSSIAVFNAEEEVKELVKDLVEDPDLREKFEVETYIFGKEVEQGADLDFRASQTNLPAVFTELSNLYEDRTAPLILITDGNQTLGEEFIFAAQRFDQPVIPVVAGDTTNYRDLNIARVNVNKYAFLNNKFPVEIMVNFSGETSVETRLEIRSGNSLVFSENLSFSPEDNSEVVRAEISAGSVGARTYEVRLVPLEGEKNVKNNIREFAVEVIDERTKVLIAYSILHPDLGALQKAIESNQQREVELVHISQVGELQDYQLVILYQPTNNFRPLFEELKSKNLNYFLVAGPATDWRFLNEQQSVFKQEITNHSEEYFPVFNENFKAFQTEDIGYSRFPPLSGNFGNLQSAGNLDVLLYRETQGLTSDVPLLAISETGGSKKAFLMGVNFWRWRSAVYQETGSFADFDGLIGNFVQFLASGNRKERLVVNYEPLYNGNEPVIIKADYFDRNYNFDPRASLVLEVKETGSGEMRQIPFLLKGQTYEVDLSSLPAAEYEFTARVNGEGLTRSGRFRIMDFDVEQQFASANLEGLQKIAAAKGEKVYFTDQFQQLKERLLSDDSFATVQKSHQKDVPLIDWKYLLAIIILALSAEWFMRKYYGQI